ncbi:MAG: hypothetical protein PF795_04645 [Kiritimatiellae bacterium]|jgi:phage I-like protein|nr:hypothetical protein [Kiritimatiellia bacterium]
MLIEALSISNGALKNALSAQEIEKGDKLPKRLKLFKWGSNPTQKGPVHVGGTPETFSAWQGKAARTRIAIDFEHNTVPGSPEYLATKEPRSVAAYATPVLLAGDGLYLEDIAWTPAGIADALNYEDLSPAPVLDKNRNLIGLHSSALTRAGATENLHFFNAELPAPISQPEMEHPNMEAELKEMLDGIMKRLDALEAAKPAEAGVEPLTGDLEKLRGTVEALNARQLQSERQAIVDRAGMEGKVIPLSAEVLAKTSPEFLSAMVEKLPVSQVPTSRKSGQPIPADVETLSNTSFDEVAKRSGYTVEQLQANSLTPKKEGN